MHDENVNASPSSHGYQKGSLRIKWDLPAKYRLKRLRWAQSEICWHRCLQSETGTLGIMSDLLCYPVNPIWEACGNSGNHLKCNMGVLQSPLNASHCKHDANNGVQLPEGGHLGISDPPQDRKGLWRRDKASWRAANGNRPSG